MAQGRNNIHSLFSFFFLLATQTTFELWLNYIASNNKSSILPCLFVFQLDNQQPSVQTDLDSL